MKQNPVRRHFPRNLRNKPCLCGATKERPKCVIKDRKRTKEICRRIHVEHEAKMVPIKAKDCCLKKVNAAYHSTLEKYVPNTGRKNYGA